MYMTPLMIGASEQQNEAINFEPHRVSDRQSILDCFLKLANQNLQRNEEFFREIFYADDGRHLKRKKVEG